jgi:hypothetical protein
MTAGRPPQPEWQRGRLYRIGLRSLVWGIFLWILLGAAAVFGIDHALSVLSSDVATAVGGVIVIAATILTAVGFSIVWRQRQQNLAASRRQPPPSSGTPVQ